MGALDAGLISLMLNSGIAQYPDAKLYNAAKMLTPEERPQVAVKPDDDKWFAGRGVKAVFREIHPKVNPDQRQINVYTRSKPYQEFDKNPHRLAAVLAHEAQHDRGNGEAAGYDKEREVLERYGEKDDKLLKLLVNRVLAEKERESR